MHLVSLACYISRPLLVKKVNFLMSWTVFISTRKNQPWLLHEWRSCLLCLELKKSQPLDWGRQERRRSAKTRISSTPSMLRLQDAGSIYQKNTYCHSYSLLLKSGFLNPVGFIIKPGDDSTQPLIGPNIGNWWNKGSWLVILATSSSSHGCRHSSRAVFAPGLLRANQKPVRVLCTVISTTSHIIFNIKMIILLFLYTDQKSSSLKVLFNYH